MGRSKNSHFNRYSQIANIVARHGLGYFVGILGLERFVPFHQGLLGHSRRTEPYTQPEHIRMAFEELGPTFIKLGQILSTRADLLTPEYQAEFAKLQDQALPVLTNAMEDILAEELGKPINDVFATFDPTPIAAASIGQVYTATLHDGTEVVVKVRRPGIVEQVEEDLEILQNLAVSASYRWELAKQYDVIGLAQEFAQTLRSELDYLREGRNAERFAKNFAHNPNVHIPRIFWESTTSRVLTMERIRGIKVSDLSALNAAGINRKTLAEQIAQLNLQMVFEDGFFHADPHPGNFFIKPNGRIGLIDFGMVGNLDANTQEHLAAILLAVISQDADRLVDAFLELGFAQQTVDRTLLRRDLQYLVSHYYGQPLGEIAIGKILNEMLDVVRRHHLQLPSNLGLFFKAGIINEGVVAHLDPSVSVTALLMPYVEKLLLRQYSPTLWAQRLSEASLYATQWGVELPRKLKYIVGELERGNLRINTQLTNGEPIVRRFERFTNRIVLSIITAALINSLAVLMLIYHPANWEKWAGYFFTVGFIAASTFGIYLIWGTLRSKH